MKQLIMVVCTLLLLNSCSKKDNNKTPPIPSTNNPNPSNTLNDLEKLVVGTWALERIVDSNYSGSTLDDVKDGVPYPCRQDDRYIFSDDRTYYQNEGADTCTGSGGPYGVLDWAIETSNNAFQYKHGPGQINSDGFFRKIDNDHFAVYTTHFGWFNKSTIKTYYYTRK